MLCVRGGIGRCCGGGMGLVGVVVGWDGRCCGCGVGLVGGMVVGRCYGGGWDWLVLWGAVERNKHAFSLVL